MLITKFEHKSWRGQKKGWLQNFNIKVDLSQKKKLITKFQPKSLPSQKKSWLQNFNIKVGMSKKTVNYKSLT